MEIAKGAYKDVTVKSTAYTSTRRTSTRAQVAARLTDAHSASTGAPTPVVSGLAATATSGATTASPLFWVCFGTHA
jgi:hypothetical protein